MIRCRFLGVAALLICTPALQSAQAQSDPPSVVETATASVDSLLRTPVDALFRQLPAHDTAWVTELTSNDWKVSGPALDSLRADRAAWPYLLRRVADTSDAMNRRLGDVAQSGAGTLPQFHQILVYLVAHTPRQHHPAEDAAFWLTYQDLIDLNAAVNARIAALHGRNEPIPPQLAAWQTTTRAEYDHLMLPTFLQTPPPVFHVASTSPSRIRVLAFGDFGTGDSAQFATAKAMVAYEKTHPFDFALILGDNFYGKPPQSPSDTVWTSIVDRPYAPLHIPLYAVLGNHDWGGDLPAVEILRTKEPNQPWHMPALYYTFTAGPVQFLMINSNDLGGEQQRSWLDSALTHSAARWKVVCGHFNIAGYADVNVGHGGEMDYNGGAPRPFHDELLSIIKGKADVYLAGHYHVMLDMQSVDGVHQFLMGTGGRNHAGLVPNQPDRLFGSEDNGFAEVDVDNNSFTVHFIDATGKELYHNTITK